MTNTNTTTTPTNPYAATVEATRGVRVGADRWALADALLAEVGQFESRSAFDAVRRATESAGVKPLSVSALRQYRDTAARYPASERVSGVSFTAHRAALASDDPTGILETLADRFGADGVTVKRVNDAVSLAAGNTPAAPKPKAPAALVVADADADSLVIALITAARSNRSEVIASLRKVSAQGLDETLALVSAAVKANAAKNVKANAWGAGTKAPAASGSTPTPAAIPTPTPAASGAVGDLRGL